MLETMYAAPGIGLAATQVNVHQRLIVVDVSEGNDEPHVLINPNANPHWRKHSMGGRAASRCPAYTRQCSDPSILRCSAQERDRRGNHHAGLGNLLAICIQHECDHLDGKLFVDYLSSLKAQPNQQKT